MNKIKGKTESKSKLRIKKIQRILFKNKCDLLVLSGADSSSKWILGKKLDQCLIFVLARGKSSIIVSALDSFSDNDFDIFIPKTRDEYNLTIKKLASKSKNVAISGSSFNFKLMQLVGGKKFIDVEEQIKKIRSLKTIEEIKKIQHANKLTAQCFNLLIKEFEAGKFSHENDVARFIKLFALENNCGLAFDPIVASGHNAAVAHHQNPTKLNAGFCVLDFGFDVDGYKADMTRTIYIGKPTLNEVKKYNQLLKIQEDVLSMVKSGALISDLHKFVVDALGHDAKLFIHSLGHGVGLDIHELPHVSSVSKAVLEEGMVITIEPGIYDPNGKSNKGEFGKFGIRIEDSVVVTKNGCINMTALAPKKLFIFEGFKE